jgi:hypothetical protein
VACYLLMRYARTWFNGTQQESSCRFNGKGGPIKSRPIVKSEFCQIPPNKLQLLDRIVLAWNECLSQIGQFVLFDGPADILLMRPTKCF